MRPKIIALTGPKGSGKTRAATNMLLSKFLDKPGILSFSTPIKDMARILLAPEAFLQQNKDDPSYGICGRTPRYLLQTLGTEWGRDKIGKNIWTEAMRLKLSQTTHKTIIIDDLRFENEAELLCDLGARIYLIQRPGVVYSEEHKSESPLPTDYLDAIITNDSLEALLKLRTWNPFE